MQNPASYFLTKKTHMLDRNEFVVIRKKFKRMLFCGPKKSALRYFVNIVQISAQETILVCDERSAD